MWIKELYATFGSLDNRQLSLKSGLNIVHGRNEAGKSTWGAFIRAMLYGISTREKAKAGYIPDKERFLPWNGNPMYGRCTLISDGDEISIERTSGKGGVFSKVEAKNLSRGSSAPTGEELCGIARGVYDRCAFIGQAKLSVDRDADTEKKILSLASSGEESVSAQEVLSRLEKRQRLIRSPRGLGSLPELEKQIEERTSEIEYARNTQDEISRTEESLGIYTEKEKSLLRATKIAEAEERKSARAFSARAAQELTQAEENFKKYVSYPSKADCDLFLDGFSEYRSLSLSAETAKASLSGLLREYEGAMSEINESRAFNGMSLALARERAATDIKRLENAEKKKISAAGVLSLCAGVLLAAGSVLMYTAGRLPVFIAGEFFALSFVAAGTVLLATAGKRERKECYRELYLRYGGTDRETVEHALASYGDALERAEEALGQVTECRALQSELSGKLEFAEKSLKETLLRFGKDAASLDAGEAIMKKMAGERESAETAVREARIRAEAIENAQTQDEEDVEYTAEEVPEMSADELRLLSLDTASVRKSLELTLAALRERLSGVDVSRAETELSGMRERERELTLSYDAYALAMKCMGEADAEMRERFSPEVEKRTAEIFSLLTDGSFEVVRIRNRDFDMDVATGAASARRDGLFLSRGTLDELYFSLRLALCELLLPEESSPPMVLDDVFVNFDDERTHRALSLLREMAKKRQIILFSCHTREARLFENDSEVNIVEL